MFTVDDIREIAVQIEQNGEQTYRRAAHVYAGKKEVGELFARMADEEQQHAQWFSSISSVRELEDAQRELELMGRRLLKEMVADQTFSLDQQCLERSENLLETLAQSRMFEEDTILFYEFLLGIVDEDETRARIDAIIAEERRHVEQIVAMIDQLKANGYPMFTGGAGSPVP